MKEGFRRNMMKRNGRILIYLLLIAVAPACKSEKSVKKVPLEYFFKNPEKTQFAISPGGEYVSYLQPHNDRLNIYVRALNSDEVTRVIAFDHDRSEEHTSELQSLMRISYAVFCL